MAIWMGGCHHLEGNVAAAAGMTLDHERPA
jgi:hypothetical protein